jgi:hypothetical protein
VKTIAEIRAAIVAVNAKVDANPVSAAKVGDKLPLAVYEEYDDLMKQLLALHKELGEAAGKIA